MHDVPAAVIFDLDGVLLDSEQLWTESKREVTEATGGRWREDAAVAMMGMSSPEWTAYMRDALAVPLDAEALDRAVVARMAARYRAHLPLLPGAVPAVRALGQRWPLGLASSSNREIIDLFLDRAGLAGAFAVTVASEEVSRGKPAPDVYLEAARRLHVDPAGCVAVEDSGNGMRAAHAAGMAIVAVPNQHYRPDADALALAAVRVAVPGEITPELVASLGT